MHHTPSISRNKSNEISCNTERAWYALYTRPNFEKKVDARLQELGLHSYLPLTMQVRQWSDRKKKIEVPLFRCYVFVYTDPKERLLSLKPRGVICMLNTKGKPSRIPDWEIDAVKRMLANDLEPETVERFKPGDLVEIVAGPLAGLQGILLENRGSDRVIIPLEGIGHSVSVKVHVDWLRPLNDSQHRPLLIQKQSIIEKYRKLLAA